MSNNIECLLWAEHSFNGFTCVNSLNSLPNAINQLLLISLLMNGESRFGELMLHRVVKLVNLVDQGSPALGLK